MRTNPWCSSSLLYLRSANLRNLMRCISHPTKQIGAVNPERGKKMFKISTQVHRHIYLFVVSRVKNFIWCAEQRLYHFFKKKTRKTKIISITNSILHVFLMQKTDLPVGCGDALVNTVSNTFSARLQNVMAALTNPANERFSNCWNKNCCTFRA